MVVWESTSCGSQRDICPSSVVWRICSDYDLSGQHNGPSPPPKISQSLPVACGHTLATRIVFRRHRSPCQCIGCPVSSRIVLYFRGCDSIFMDAARRASRAGFFGHAAVGGKGGQERSACLSFTAKKPPLPLGPRSRERKCRLFCCGVAVFRGIPTLLSRYQELYPLPFLLPSSQACSLDLQPNRARRPTKKKPLDRCTNISRNEKEVVSREKEEQNISCQRESKKKKTFQH
jgi:hypothetical protein